MDNIKSPLRRCGRISGLILISHQLLFQLISGVLITLGLIFLEIIGLSQLESSVLYLASDIAMLISAIIFLIFYFVNRSILREQTPAKATFSLASFLKCIIIILGVNSFLSAVDAAFNYFTGLSLTFPSDTSAAADPLILFLAVGVFPAIAEELIFRGVIYRYLRRYGVVFAAFASSLLFGLIHLNLLQALFAFAMGLVLCFAYERSGRLVFPMLLHFINNSLMVLITVLPIDMTIVKTAECAAGAVAFIFAVGYLTVIKCRRKRLFTVEDKELAKKCLYFFTSIPMALLVIICTAVCVLVIFM